METAKEFISKNWQFIIYIAGLFIIIGKFLANDTAQDSRLNTLEIKHEKLYQQVTVVDEEKIDLLEEWQAEERGYKRGWQDALNTISK